MSTNSATPPPAKVLLGCSKCGASLPDEAQFCLKCGKPVSSPPKSPALVESPPPEVITRPRPKRRWLLWTLLAILAGVISWALISDSTGAQLVQEFVGFKQDRVILDSEFSVGPRAFRYYKFALPEGSVNVAVVGQFTSAADNQVAGNRKKQPGDKSKGKANDDASDNAIQVYVLTEPAFTVWQNGYATSSVYDSGNVAEGSVHADIPAGAGIYYLVFSNKSAPKTPKAVHATVVLRYKSWLPNWVRRMKGRFVDWVGLG
jgi:zinc-ribbon domain